MMSVMTNPLPVQDIFDIARLNGATPSDISDAVSYITRLGSTGTQTSRERCGDLIVVGLFYEKGWLG